ncbi:uncharacterized protein OCT59_027140 [Rhizophagus irregularis]|uniref:uncharacterized protein n=1 Tax=Rhizophagus irregularis TaxID=588596 RepID=UPI00331DA469|nr:hypothetical protein OCT59_027140 [Rhizophagus irregularis]
MLGASKVTAESLPDSKLLWSGNANNDGEGVPDAPPPTYGQIIEDIEWRASFGVSNGKSYFCNNLRYCGAAFYSKDSIRYHVCGDKYTFTKNRKYYN